MGRKSRMKKERRKAKNNLNKHQKESRTDFETMDRNTESIERLIKRKGKKEHAMGIPQGKKALRTLVKKGKFDKFIFIYGNQNEIRTLSSLPPKTLQVVRLELLGSGIAQILEERFGDHIDDALKDILHIAEYHMKNGIPVGPDPLIRSQLQL
jgi:hypothetical protein